VKVLTPASAVSSKAWTCLWLLPGWREGRGREGEGGGRERGSVTVWRVVQLSVYPLIPPVLPFPLGALPSCVVLT